MPTEAKPDSVAAVVALANRLIALKASPGFNDLRLLGNILEHEADEAVRNYRGTDKDELFILNLRRQIATNLIAEFFGRLETAIDNAKGLPGFQQETGKEPIITERIAGSY
jgi:hypothetical protein